MEHDDRAPVASFYVEGAFRAGSTTELTDAAAHHARVKRLAAGDNVRVTDGAGNIGTGVIASLGKAGLRIEVERVELVGAPPAIHLRVPVGDRERMLWLAEKATELGIASWQAVRFRRSASVSPRGEGPAFAEKARARMIAALEQSGGAWLPRMLADATPESIDVGANASRIVLDARGPWLTTLLPSLDGGEPTIVFGPEGGVEPDELEALRAAGWRPARVAATTLRFETAGLAALSVCRNIQLPREG